LRLFFDDEGAVDHQVDSFDGEITWRTDDGSTHSSRIHSEMTIEFPDGIDFFKPARITVTGRHGAALLIGGAGPPGSGKLEYDGFIFSLDEDGFVSWAVEGDPTWMSGNFENEARRICAALA
jgi:hypothetical protein